MCFLCVLSRVCLILYYYICPSESFKGRRRKPMEKPKIWPIATLKPLNQSFPKFASMIKSRAKFWSDPCRFFLPICVKIIITQGLKNARFWVLHLTYSRGPHTDIHAKYVKDAVPCKDVPFGSFESKNLYLGPIFAKNCYFEDRF